MTDLPAAARLRGAAGSEFPTLASGEMTMLQLVDGWLRSEKD